MELLVNQPISINLRMLTDEIMTDVIVRECSVCFAIVRETKMGDHFAGAHGDN
jgi:hypothetical protein